MGLHAVLSDAGWGIGEEESGDVGPGVRRNVCVGGWWDVEGSLGDGR